MFAADAAGWPVGTGLSTSDDQSTPAAGKPTGVFFSRAHF